MVSACLVNSQGQLLRGGEELLQQWQADAGSHLWIDLNNESTDVEDRIMAALKLHPLAITDARRQRHPPKLEVFDDHLFILLRGLDANTRPPGDSGTRGADEHSLEFGTIQIALFAAPHFLLTRHAQPSLSINHWQQAEELTFVLKEGGIRLALEIATTAARRYLDLMLDFEPRLTELEDQLQDKPDDSAMRELTGYRTRLRKLRRIFSYHARLFENLRMEKTPFFDPGSKHNKHQLIDVYEKYERLLSLCSMYYELAGDLIDGYISLSSHNLNNTMRVLTVLTAIFVPLGFLAGLYGMNFDYMPELHWRGGYFVLLGVMATIIVSLLAVFKYKRWL